MSLYWFRKAIVQSHCVSIRRMPLQLRVRPLFGSGENAIRELRPVVPDFALSGAVGSRVGKLFSSRINGNRDLLEDLEGFYGVRIIRVLNLEQWRVNKKAEEEDFVFVLRELTAKIIVGPHVVQEDDVRV